MVQQTVLSIKSLSWGKPQHVSREISTDYHYRANPMLGVGKCNIMIITLASF